MKKLIIPFIFILTIIGGYYYYSNVIKKPKKEQVKAQIVSIKKKVKVLDTKIEKMQAMPLTPSVIITSTKEISTGEISPIASSEEIINKALLLEKKYIQELENEVSEMDKLYTETLNEIDEIGKNIEELIKLSKAMTESSEQISEDLDKLAILADDVSKSAKQNIKYAKDIAGQYKKELNAVKALLNVRKELYQAQLKEDEDKLEQVQNKFLLIIEKESAKLNNMSEAFKNEKFLESFSASLSQDFYTSIKEKSSSFLKKAKDILKK